jgi:heat shock protein HslJ
MKTLLLVLATLTLAGCNLIGGATGPAVTIAGRTFISTSVTQAGEPRPLVDGTKIRLTFGADGSLGAQAGCNMMGGTYRIDAGILKFDGGWMTEMACDPERDAQDAWFSEFLGSGPRLSLRGNELTLTADDTTITLLDRQIAEPDLPLVGPGWTVTTIIDNDVATNLGDVTATLVFDAAGNVTFNAGCNTGGGRYRIDGNRMVFSDLVTTDMACDGARAQMEAAVLRTLQGNPTWAIEASNLRLMVGNQGLELVGATDLLLREG